MTLRRRNRTPGDCARISCVLTPCRILDIQKVLDGDIEIEAMDSHNNWYVPAALFTCT